jgi:hypothetical protein
MMRKYQELLIRGPHETLLRLPDEIEKRLADGWSRNHAREAELRLEPPAFCFHCEAEGEREEANLWLVFGDSNELRASGIATPMWSGLSLGQYNLILDEFSKKFAEPVAVVMGLQPIINPPDVTPQQLLPPEVTSTLEYLAERVSPTPWACPPSDKARWQAFLIGAHQAHSELDGITLSRWLIEKAGWPHEAARGLGVEYQMGRSLLETYEHQLQDA